MGLYDLPTWLFITIAGLLLMMILEIGRLFPLLLKELKLESDFVLPIETAAGRLAARLSIIIPAKDEEASIVGAVESILASSYKNLEIILIDDRSQDGTWDLMEQLRSKDSRVRTVKIEELPAGWTGKTHAMFVGAGLSTGDILLFTDADVFFSSDLVARSVSYFISNQLAMLSLIPGFNRWGFLEKSIYPHLALGISFFYPIGHVNDPGAEAAVSSGCFIMMSKEAYNNVGTWRAVRDQLTEDIAMSRAVKNLGMKLHVARSDLVKTKPFDNFSELIRFWTRTFYGGLETRTTKIIRLWLNYSPLLLPFILLIYFGVKLAANSHISSPEAILLFMSIIAIMAIEIPFGIFLKHYHGSWSYTLLSPLGIFAGSLIATRVFFTKTLDRGIEWRGSVYK
ncbi:MAG: glycosyltransferase [Desulfomonilaceae bacterium]